MNAISHYRYERVIIDLVLYAEDILLRKAEGADREQAFHYLTWNFAPGGTIEMAHRGDTILVSG
ncbi:MAG: hypothetical protein JW750_00885 [Anaerolineaceae bacterium]|nr:hypothetical protein [Anaerolineaceae bacterium]